MGPFNTSFSFLLPNRTTAVRRQTKRPVLISLSRCPSTRFFITVFPQPIALSPGMSLTLPVIFRPTEKVKWKHQICSQCPAWLSGKEPVLLGGSSVGQHNPPAISMCPTAGGAVCLWLWLAVGRGLLAQSIPSFHILLLTSASKIRHLNY